VEEHYCVVCEKRFRSAGQLANHERSKKHLEAVAELRQLLEEEEQDAEWLLVSVAVVFLGQVASKDAAARDVAAAPARCRSVQGVQGLRGSGFPPPKPRQCLLCFNTTV
jgi:hypothetical protein